MEKAREQNAEEQLQRALNMFKCVKDSDIEDFLQRKAIDCVDRGICSVYLIIDEDEFLNNIIKIYAYYTLSHKSISFAEDLSKSKIKKLSGFKYRKETAIVLIGHLGKYISNEEEAEITIADILDYSFEVIKASNELIPCRAVLVECSEIIHKSKIYERVGFTYLQRDEQFYQYYKVID